MAATVNENDLVIGAMDRVQWTWMVWPGIPAFLDFWQIILPPSWPQPPQWLLNWADKLEEWFRLRAEAVPPRTDELEAETQEEWLEDVWAWACAYAEAETGHSWAQVRAWILENEPVGGPG